MDLEKELQQLAIADGFRIEDDLDAFGVIAVVAIGRVRHLTAGVADPGRDYAGIPAQQILHAPEAAAGKDCAFRRNCHVRSPWFAAVVGFRALSGAHNEAERCKSANNNEPSAHCQRTKADRLLITARARAYPSRSVPRPRCADAPRRTGRP